MNELNPFIEYKLYNNEKIRVITNLFNRILYINNNYPIGRYIEYKKKHIINKNFIKIKTISERELFAKIL